MSEYGISECCGAEVIMHDICSQCGEHCDIVDDGDEPIFDDEISEEDTHDNQSNR